MSTQTTVSERAVQSDNPRSRLSSPSNSKQQANVRPFPLRRRLAKVHGVAGKLIATKTERHARYYREQVTFALGSHLASCCVPAAMHAGEIAGFWRAVDLEAIRLRAKDHP